MKTYTRLHFNFNFSNTHIKCLHVYHLVPKRRAADNPDIALHLNFNNFTDNTAPNAANTFFAVDRNTLAYGAHIVTGKLQT